MRCFTSQRPGLWILIVSFFFLFFSCSVFVFLFLFFSCCLSSSFALFVDGVFWCCFLVFFCLPCLVWCFAIFLQSRLSNCDWTCLQSILASSSFLDSSPCKALQMQQCCSKQMSQHNSFDLYQTVLTGFVWWILTLHAHGVLSHFDLFRSMSIISCLFAVRGASKSSNWPTGGQHQRPTSTASTRTWWLQLEVSLQLCRLCLWPSWQLVQRHICMQHFGRTPI